MSIAAFDAAWPCSLRWGSPVGSTSRVEPVRDHALRDRFVLNTTGHEPIDHGLEVAAHDH